MHTENVRKRPKATGTEQACNQRAAITKETTATQYEAPTARTHMMGRCGKMQQWWKYRKRREQDTQGQTERQ